MRSKADNIDYRYFCEPNIIALDITKQLVTAKKELKHSLTSAQEELRKLKLQDQIIEQLLDNYPMYQAFKYVNDIIHDPNLTITWIMMELASILNTQHKNFNDITQQKYQTIIDMLDALQQGNINNKQAKTIFEQIINTNKSVDEIINAFGFKQIKDDQVIKNIIQTLIKANPNMVNQYATRPERVEKFFVGMVMKQTKGQANPEVTINTLRKLLSSHNS
jgi:aspartyl-tRNA(Asn)/glutamyl-tRNA(Gln) amidotransferase subunit B